MANAPIRVLNVQSKWLVSEAIADALESASLAIVYSGCDLTQAITAATSKGWDVAVLHERVALDQSGRCCFAEKIRGLNPNMRMILILEELDRSSVVRAFRAGAGGVLSENSSLAQLADCINWVHKGNVWASSEELEYLVSAMSESAGTVTDGIVDTLLSARERQVVDEVAKGLTNREIGVQLGLSECTVRNHLYRIFDKVGVYSRVELALWISAHTNASEAKPPGPVNRTTALAANRSKVVAVAMVSQHRSRLGSDAPSTLPPI